MVTVGIAVIVAVVCVVSVLWADRVKIYWEERIEGQRISHENMVADLEAAHKRDKRAFGDNLKVVTDQLTAAAEQRDAMIVSIAPFVAEKALMYLGQPDRAEPLLRFLYVSHCLGLWEPLENQHKLLGLGQQVTGMSPQTLDISRAVRA